MSSQLAATSLPNEQSKKKEQQQQHYRPQSTIFSIVARSNRSLSRESSTSEFE
jgi:hypothetical protein